MKRLMIMVTLAIGLAPLAGCVVAAGPGPRPGPAAHCVAGFYGASGVWHPGHCS